MTSWVYLNNGTLSTNNTTQTWARFRSRPCNSNWTRTLNLGASTINITQNVWEVADFNLLTLNAGTSTINMQAVNPTFNNFVYCNSGQNTPAYYNVNFTAASGVANLYNEYSSPGSQINTTFNQVNFSAGGNITGDFTVGTLSFTSNNTYNFQAGRTVTVTNNIAFNSVCFGGVTIQSATAGSQAILNKLSGIVSGQNLTIKDINASGGATYNAYGSTNMGNNTGWNFIANPAIGAIGAVTPTANGFTVPLVTGAVSYTWTLPAGSVIQSGQGTNTIVATVNSGQVCVVASNGCGSNTSSSCYSAAVDYISLNSAGVFVSENFNTLANSSVSNTFPVGWRIFESGANADLNYSAGTGSSNSGDSYSFGLSGSSLRTLGSLQSGSLVSTTGAVS